MTARASIKLHQTASLQQHPGDKASLGQVNRRSLLTRVSIKPSAGAAAAAAAGRTSVVGHNPIGSNSGQIRRFSRLGTIEDGVDTDEYVSAFEERGFHQGSGMNETDPAAQWHASRIQEPLTPTSAEGSPYHSESSPTDRDPSMPERKSAHYHKHGTLSTSCPAVQATGYSIEQLLHRTPMFRECSYDCIDSLLLHMKKRIVQAGTQLVRQGCAVHRSVFLIVFGAVDIMKIGDESHMVHLSEGATFGEDMVLGVSSKWRYSARTSQASMVVEITHHNLVDLTFTKFPDDHRHFSKVPTHHILAEQQDHGKRWRVFKNCAVLAHCSDEFLQALDHKLERRLYFPGQKLVGEWDTKGDLYFFELGSARVEIHGRIIAEVQVPHLRTDIIHEDDRHLHKHIAHMQKDLKRDRAATGPLMKAGSSKVAGSTVGEEREDFHCASTGEVVPEALVYGEETMLGIIHHITKTVYVRTLSNVRVMPRAVFLELLEEARIIDREYLKIWLDPCQILRSNEIMKLEELEGFSPLAGSGCSKEFWQYCTKHLEERLFGSAELVQLDDSHRQIEAENLVPDANFSVCKIHRGVCGMVAHDWSLYLSENGTPTKCSVYCGADCKAGLEVDPGEEHTGNIIGGHHF